MGVIAAGLALCFMHLHWGLKKLWLRMGLHVRVPHCDSTVHCATHACMCLHVLACACLHCLLVPALQFCSRSHPQALQRFFDTLRIQKCMAT